MKVKNIMFFGFAAAILSAGAASAAVTPNASEKNIVTSKYYVDSLVGNETNDMATQTWVQSQNYLTQHQDISGKQDKIQNATTGDITTTDANGQTQDSGKSFDTASGTISPTNANAIPSSAQVAGYVTTQITASAYDDTEVRNLISTNATNITTNATNITTNANDIDALESGKQDKIQNATTGDITTTDANGQTQDSGKAFDTASGTITADSTTAIPSSAQVAGYVQSITNGNTIPAQDSTICDGTHPCALVNENGTLSWKRMAQPGA